MEGLKVTINVRQGKGGDSVEDEGCIPLDQHHPQPLEQVSDGVILLLARSPGLSPGQLLQLLSCLLVPSPQCFHWERDET